MLMKIYINGKTDCGRACVIREITDALTFILLPHVQLSPGTHLLRKICANNILYQKKKHIYIDKSYCFAHLAAGLICLV